MQTREHTERMLTSTEVGARHMRAVHLGLCKRARITQRRQVAGVKPGFCRIFVSAEDRVAVNQINSTRLG